MMSTRITVDIKLKLLESKTNSQIFQKRLVTNCFQNLPFHLRQSIDCNVPFNRFHRHCREWYLHNNTENNLDD